ncbi:hypothetical protein NHX12_031107 [Muraenolepis orangiensis]|uniref:Uncharacterized protein n=1 Tax=Muraenolepis orangiensis TaxID=630683 RepID=A0A9Q0EDF3_9TELE|nr:hypothetical protein NHX12_031107 [Muraenolepis orangiensis]
MVLPHSCRLGSKEACARPVGRCGMSSVLSWDARSWDAAQREEEPVAEAPPVPPFPPVGDFLLEQSRDDTLRSAD